MAMDTILATIVDGGRAIVVIYREAVEIILFLIKFIIWFNPTPSAEAPGGGVRLDNKTMPLERKTAPSWWGCLWAVF